jgi:hypothetical protein
LQIPLSVVKGYLTDKLRRDSEAAHEDRQQISAYREGTAEMRSEIQDLRAKVKDFKETRCAQVNVPSDMPALHFVCQHPKHAQFLNDDREAAIYSAMSRPSSAMDGGADMGAVRQLEEAFYGQVDGAVRKRRDGFGTIAEYFGKGLFSNMQQQSQD